jgi:hypothetical protein
MTRGDGSEPGPGIPAVALGALPGVADLPCLCPLQQLLHRLRAGLLRPADEREHVVRGDAQHAGLAAALQVLPQFRAGAVDLVSADEVEGEASAYASPRMSTASWPLVRNRRSNGSPAIRDVTGSLMSSGNPLARPGQRVTGLLPHVGQVRRVDPVRDAACAPHVLPLHPGRGRSLPLLAGLVERADRHPAAARPAGRVVKTRRRVPPDQAHRHPLVPRGTAQQTLCPGRRPVLGVLGDRPAVPRRQVAGQRVQVLPACSHVCVRAKHDRSGPSRTDRSRTARLAPILAAAAALFSFVLTNNMIPGGCTHVTAISPAPAST